jgi:hypothetical protein
MDRNSPKGISFGSLQDAEFGLAEPRCVPQHSSEYGFQLTGRTADHLQHLGGRRLLFERLAQLVEQPCILDGDDGLRGEILGQLDLLIRWPPSSTPATAKGS